VKLLADTLGAYISRTVPKDRTTGPEKHAADLATQLATSLPIVQGDAIRTRLDDLRVQVIELAAVPHRMIYDKRILAAQAGKPLEIRFSNSDNMPHNFALVQPGSLQEMGELAEATAASLAAPQRHYIPNSRKILRGSRLLEPGQSQVLSFNAPSEPGVYPYVCTYPGHWRRMYGAMYVVADLKSHTTDPAAYLAAHPLPLA